jgi:hypothetical protein
MAPSSCSLRTHALARLPRKGTFFALARFHRVMAPSLCSLRTRSPACRGRAPSSRSPVSTAERHLLRARFAHARPLLPRKGIFFALGPPARSVRSVRSRARSARALARSLRTPRNLPP